MDTKSNRNLKVKSALESIDSDLCKMSQLYTINGIDVKFPCKPYPSQFAMMDRIIKSLERQQNCLLESPTGTGKSLALLCASLAWQKTEREKIEAANSNSNFEACRCDCHKISLQLPEDKQHCAENTPSGFLEGHFADDDNDFKENFAKPSARSGIELKAWAQPSTPVFVKSNKSANNASLCTLCSCSQRETNAKKKVPKIFFGTRTHKQIAQMVRELKKTAYKNTRMTILSSRDHTCIHPDVSQMSGKSEACSERLDGPGCNYFNRVRNFAFHSLQEAKGFSLAWDLEDLVTLYRQHKVCPYFGARQLMSTADLILCPYNYLIDPKIRKTMEINLQNQIVILDESHNIEDSAREAASLTISQKQLLDSTNEINILMQYGMMIPELTSLLSLIEKLDKLINSSHPAAQQSDYNEVSKIWTGIEMIALLDSYGIGAADIHYYQKCYEKVAGVEKLSESGQEKEQEIKLKGPSHILLEGFFVEMDFMYRDNMKFVDDFRVALTGAMVYEDGDYRSSNEWLSKKNKRQYQRQLTWSYSLNFWCMNPCVAFSDLGNVTRSIILTSGTLSPMSSFQSELGVPFPIQLEANHVIDKSQTWVGSLAKGPSGCTLLGTYQNVDTFLYQDDIGHLVLQTCQSVPNGILCFFSSYKVLEKMTARWQCTGLWQKLTLLKAVMAEPRSGDKVDFDELLKTYYQTITASLAPKNGEITGALLLAVCRGKVSEGLDFADSNARAVILVGIPYPNIKDTQVELKKKYNDRHSNERGLLNGKSWYEIQAFRALNQALGRCLRHRYDWGALILADERFGRLPNIYAKGLSKWVRERIQHFDQFENMHQALMGFINYRKEHSNELLEVNVFVESNKQEVTEVSDKPTYLQKRNLQDVLMPSRNKFQNLSPQSSLVYENQNENRRVRKPRKPRDRNKANKPYDKIMEKNANLQTDVSHMLEITKCVSVAQPLPSSGPGLNQRHITELVPAASSAVQLLPSTNSSALTTVNQEQREPNVTNTLLTQALSTFAYFKQRITDNQQANMKPVQNKLEKNIQPIPCMLPRQPIQKALITGLPTHPVKNSVLLTELNTFSAHKSGQSIQAMPLTNSLMDSLNASPTSHAQHLETNLTVQQVVNDVITYSNIEQPSRLCDTLKCDSIILINDDSEIVDNQVCAAKNILIENYSEQFSSFPMDTQMLVNTDLNAIPQRVKSLSPDLFDSGCSKDSVDISRFDNRQAVELVNNADNVSSDRKNIDTSFNFKTGVLPIRENAESCSWSCNLQKNVSNNVSNEDDHKSFVTNAIKYVIKTKAKGVIFIDSPEKKAETCATPNIDNKSRESRFSKLSLSKERIKGNISNACLQNEEMLPTTNLNKKNEQEKMENNLKLQKCNDLKLKKNLLDVNEIELMDNFKAHQEIDNGLPLPRGSSQPYHNIISNIQNDNVFDNQNTNEVHEVSPVLVTKRPRTSLRYSKAKTSF